MLEEDVGTAVEKNDKRLDELAGGEAGLPLADLRSGRFNVPGPTEIGKTSHPTA